LDTKWKKWTAHKAVKIVSFILVIVLTAVMLSGLLSILINLERTNVLPGIVLVDITDRDGMVNFGLSEGMINFQYDMISNVRNTYIRNMVIMVAAFILIIALVIIQLNGAGRIYGAEAEATFGNKNVYFLPIDKPYLDISLAVVAACTIFCVYLYATFANSIWGLGNLIALYLLGVAASIVAVTPIGIWLLGFAKRVKAGKVWKHTLIYALPAWICKMSIKFFKYIWAGARIMTKAVIIALASLFTLLFVGIIGAVSRNGTAGPLILTAVLLAVFIAVLLLRYAKRINTLELGVMSVSRGALAEPIDVGGGELGNIADSINNISEGINNAVEQRLKSERLKTELITNVSHDIRTPLTSIITYTDLLKHEGLDCEKAPEYLDIIVQKSQRLKLLTEELFEAAKAASGNIDVHINELDIVSLINQVLGELDGTIKTSGLELRVNMPEYLLVRADGKLMWRVLENLFSNVFRYALKESRVYLDVTAEASNVTIGDSEQRFSPDSAFVRVDIKNISAVALNVDPSELTERFKRGDDSRSDGGSGLGLSIVQSVVTAQGGRFEITIDGDLFKATVHLPMGFGG